MPINQSFPVYELSSLHLSEQEKKTKQRLNLITKKSKTKLIIDPTTRLTSSELRWNVLHGESTMVQRDTLLAKPANRVQIKYLLSQNVSRLCALPANLETALSTTLCDVNYFKINFFLLFYFCNYLFLLLLFSYFTNYIFWLFFYLLKIIFFVNNKI